MYSVGNKIVTVGNKFPERRVNTINFIVDGEKFPNPTTIIDQRNFFYFESIGPETVIVNWGDGEIDSYTFGTDNTGGGYRIGWTADGSSTDRGLGGNSLAPVHIYSDGNTGQRNISFEFSSISNISILDVENISLFSFPEELSLSKNLNSIKLEGVENIPFLPKSLEKNVSLKKLKLVNAFPQALDVLPNSFFVSQLEELNVSGSFNLSDNISSNFFKINQIKDTLIRFEAGNCNIQSLPESFKELINLDKLNIRGTDEINNPELVEPLVLLRYLAIGLDDQVQNLPDFGNHNKLRTLFIGPLNPVLINQIPQKYIGLVSIKTFFNVLKTSVINDDNFDLFINSIYELVTVNAYLDPSTAGSQEEYPNKFRDVTYGDPELTQSGNIEAPPQFVQGSNNGNPINQGQKIYVLVNNYGHTVTTS